MASQPAVPPKDAGNIASDSASAGADLAVDHIIYPVDGHKIDTISTLLASYPESVNVIPHNSVGGWGMLYWVATISPAQVRELSSNKQVQEVVRKLMPHEIEDPYDY